MPQQPDRRARTLAHNTLALTIGRFGSKILVFLLVRFYTAVLSHEEYGVADLITSAANFLIPLACLGLSSGFFRFAAEARSRREQTDIFSTGLSLLAVSAMGFALLSPLLFFIPHIGEYAVLIILYVLCANIHYFVSDFVRAQGRYQLFAVQGLLNTALNITLNILFLLPLRLGVTGYVLSTVLADLLTSCFLFIYCRLWQYIRAGAADKGLLAAMLRYCLPLIPASMCWWITNTSDRYMVTAFCGEAANGLYAAAYKIPNLLVIAAGIFTDAWQFSALVERRRAAEGETAAERQARRRSFTSFFSKIMTGYSGFLFTVCTLMMLLSYPAALILFDAAFVPSWVYIPVLLLATVLSALCNFTASVYMVERRSMAAFLTSLIGALGNIVLNFILIPLWGAMGAAVATAISYLLVLIIRLISTRRSIPYRFAPIRMTAGLVLLSVMAALISCVPYGVWWALIPGALVLLLNVPPLFYHAKRLLDHRRIQAKKEPDIHYP